MQSNTIQSSATGSKLPMILLALGAAGVIVAIVIAASPSSSASPTVIVTTTTDQVKHGGIGSPLATLFGGYTPSQQDKAEIEVLSLKNILDSLHVSLA